MRGEAEIELRTVVAGVAVLESASWLRRIKFIIDGEDWRVLWTTSAILLASEGSWPVREKFLSIHRKDMIGGSQGRANQVMVWVDQHPWSSSRALLPSDILVTRKHHGASSAGQSAATGGLTVGWGHWRSPSMLAAMAVTVAVESGL